MSTPLTLKQSLHAVTALVKTWGVPASPSVSDHSTTPRARASIRDEDKSQTAITLTPHALHQAFEIYLINGEFVTFLHKLKPNIEQTLILLYHPHTEEAIIQARRTLNFELTQKRYTRRLYVVT